MNPLDQAKKLIDWIHQKLVFNATLTTSDIATFYAPQFQVRANGRLYAANYENYLQFLNTFRSTIVSIRHHCIEFHEANHAVIFADQVEIVRTDGQKDHFEAMVILKFNDENKIISWHEVYILLVA